MPFAQTADLPPLDISPVHTQITIHPSNGQYIAYVVTDMSAFPIPIRLTPHDVKSLNMLLQKSIQQVASTFGQKSNYELALSELARMGNYAFQRIFSDPSSQAKLRDILNAGTIVQIVSQEFFIPWDLLYDGPLDANANISYYWGMKYIISRTIMQDSRQGAYVSPIMQSKRPRVGLITSDRLPFVIKQELPMFKELHRRRRIHLTSLRELSMPQRSDELAAFGQFLAQEMQIIHFACHAYEQDPIETSYLSITKDFSISMIDFVVNQYDLKYHPFVILNACLTGSINPLYTSFWAEKLWERGARGVLATDFYVPDAFAASFSAELYQHLLATMPVGEALLTTRHQFWKQHRNPLALAYALYSSPSIKISRSTKK